MRSARYNHLSNIHPTANTVILLRRPIEQRPSKTGAPPVSQTFDGRHFNAPNKGKTRSKCKPGHLAPLLGSWGAAASRFKSMEDVSMEREGKAGGGRVSIGSSCVVCCCVRMSVSGYVSTYVSNLCSAKIFCLNPLHKYMSGV